MDTLPCLFVSQHNRSAKDIPTWTAVTTASGALFDEPDDNRIALV